QCQASGINVNFAPVVDVNNNAANPVINVRSFGEDRFNVASKAYAYMKGLGDANVIACAKHFPGHGDTDMDSHHDLPTIPHDRARLDSIELFPFKMMIRQGIPAMMVAHLQVPALDNRPNSPTSVSKYVTTDLLRNEMGFEGLTFTDGMEMKGVTKHYPPGEADIAAFMAGNDIICLPENMDISHKVFLAAVKNGTVPIARLEESVRRILNAKYDLGLNLLATQANPNTIMAVANSRRAQVIKAQLYEQAITLVRDDNGIFPIKELSSQKMGSISLGAGSRTTFQRRLMSYVDIDNSFLKADATTKDYNLKLAQLERKDLVFVSIHNMSRLASRNFGINQEQINFINTLSQKTKVVLVIFGSPYSLAKFENISTVIVAYEEDKMAQEAAAQGIMGANDISGKLPVSASTRYPNGTGIHIPNINRLGYAIPEAVGLNTDTLNKIQSIVDELIKERAAPGCQVLIAKNNKVVYHKAFGHHTYDKKVPVQVDDIYDLASVTKVLASSLSAMHLEDAGKFQRKAFIKQYIPGEDTTNKADLVYEDIMAHMGGLKSWIPFYRPTLSGEKKKVPSKDYYKPSPQEGFDIPVASHLFLRNDYPDTMWRKVFSSGLRNAKNYRYSDLAFYIMNKTVQNISGYQVDGYAEINFYNPLGLRNTMFNPYRILDLNHIVPSEKDDYWRHAKVHGYVHDMGAAMMGGVSGHAGLFSNCYEIGVLMQMMLNNGNYGGKQYIEPATIHDYTERHWRSTRRGIGWDMKELNPDKKLNMSEKASLNAFGHLGFTGTAAIADPDHDLVFVFLSNRTYPSMKNNKLGKNDYRPKIHTVVYDALMTP
ncbi:MAG: beta-N-acetylhexosaminidase, partial [Saprospiraceae bacterium]